ncbi:MAG: efflux RND transporter periplasmic adaptor subunit [Pirellulales bacterium]
METERKGAVRHGGWLPTLAVLASLGAIGWCGHATHWDPSHLSELWEEEPEAPPAQPAKHAEGSSPTTVKPVAVDPLPVVEFPSRAAAQKCGISTGVAEARAMNDYIRANGVVEYDQTHLAQLTVRVPGVVWRVERRVGDVVAQGDILAIIDAAEVGEAKAQLLQACVEFNLKVQTVERLRDLSTAIPARELREAEAEVELSRAHRFNAIQKLVNLGYPLHLDDIKALSVEDLAKHLNLLGLPETLASETDSANLIPLVAPFDGIITSCEIVRGEMVDSSKPQYVMADTSRMWLDLDVRQEDAGKLPLAASVTFEVEGGSRQVSGKLTWIGTEIDTRTRTIRARAEFDNPLLDTSQEHPAARRLLQAGAFGTARILVTDNPATVVVPEDALLWQWELGCELVFIPSAEGRTFTPRPVSKGLSRDGYVQILEGLQADEPIVVAGTRVLSSELSDLLQPQIGDNAEAVRVFNHVPQPKSNGSPPH